MACEKRDSRLEPDGNEQRQEHQHERGPHRVDRRTQSHGQKHACSRHETDDERVAPVEGLTQAANCPLTGTLLHFAHAAGQLSRNGPLFERGCIPPSSPVEWISHLIASLPGWPIRWAWITGP